MDPEDREFMRELLLRHEKATNPMIEGLNQATAESRRRTEEIRVRIEEIRVRTEEFRDDIRAHRREFVEEMRAQRQALFRILDRLDGSSA
jgi:methyl-accepting chemotaxis protein